MLQTADESRRPLRRQTLVVNRMGFLVRPVAFRALGKLDLEHRHVAKVLFIQVFDVNHAVARLLVRRQKPVELLGHRDAVLFWLFWISNTIKNVMMVVSVLITNCQFSEKWNSGPTAAQASTVSNAAQNTNGEPAHRVTPDANRSKRVNSGEWAA